MKNIDINGYIHICKYTCTYILDVDVYTWVYVNIYVNSCIYIHPYTFICIHSCAHTHTQTHVLVLIQCPWGWYLVHTSITHQDPFWLVSTPDCWSYTPYWLLSILCIRNCSIFLHFLNNKQCIFRLEAFLEFIASIPNFNQWIRRTRQHC